MSINGVTLILLCKLAGEIAATLLGTALLFTIFVFNVRWNNGTASTAGGLLSLLGLLYIPAGVCLVLHLNRPSGDWLPTLMSLMISSTRTRVVTGRAMYRVSATSIARRAN
ncbi:MAG: hypothetical protein Hals2KO_15130 [Halioglobus sp.]